MYRNNADGAVGIETGKKVLNPGQDVVCFLYCVPVELQVHRAISDNAPSSNWPPGRGFLRFPILELDEREKRRRTTTNERFPISLIRIFSVGFVVLKGCLIKGFVSFDGDSCENREDIVFQFT